MIRTGRDEGWLSLKPLGFRNWAEWYEVDFNGVEIATLDGKGQGLVCGSAGGTSSNTHPLITVPSQLILSKDNVDLHSKIDKHLADVLEAAGDFTIVYISSIIS